MRLASAVAEKVVPISEKVYERASSAAGSAGQAISQGAQVAYRAALAHPRASIAGLVVAVGVIGGTLWYLFGNSRKPVERRRKGVRVRAVSERRKRGRAHASA